MESHRFQPNHDHHVYQRFLITAGFIILSIVIGVSCQTRPTPAQVAEQWVQTQMEDMSLSRMVSQLFIVAIPERESGFDPDSIESLHRWINGFQAGGIVLFRHSPLEQASLVADLQAVSRIPLLIAQDMEWGAAMRVDHATELPRAMAIGATGDPELARQAGRVTAEEARRLGVNLILAPVADVNSNPRNPVIGTRSFGDSPAKVGIMASRFVEGVQSRGVLATVKHFPGHGAVSVDSHTELPLVNPERIRTDSLDLLPFKMAVESGVGAVMTAHVAFDDVLHGDPVPATLSEHVVSSLLRNHLGFEGLIISDALNMAGISGNLDPGDVAVRSLEAGVDLLLMSPDPETAHDSIMSAIRSGRISETRIRRSVERIIRAKSVLKLHLRQEPDLSGIRSSLSGAEHRSLAAAIARRSLVLLKNDGILPISSPVASILVIPLVESAATERETVMLNRLAENLNGSITSHRITTISWRQSIDAIAREARKYDVVILIDLASEYRPQPNSIRAILTRLAGADRPLVFAAMASPYSAARVPDAVNAVLVSFGGPDVSAEAVSEAIVGTTGVCGKLPIDLSERFRNGSGLCIPQTSPRIGYPGDAGMSTEDAMKIDSLVIQAIADSAFPGAALAVGRDGVITHLEGYGRYMYDKGPNVTPESIFDLASLTKVIATTTAMMQLYEAGQISLQDRIASYLPRFASGGKSGITIRHLLTHTSGLIPFRRFYEDPNTTRDDVIDRILSDSLDYETESLYRYSDFGPIILALIVEKVSGMPFDRYARERIFQPLGMLNTGFRRTPGTSDPTIVPTERDDYFRHRLIQGEVHDEAAYLLGGTAGHAGLFSTAHDLARFAFMMVHDGRIGDHAFLKPGTIRLFTTAVDREQNHTRALGWDTRSPSGYSSAGQHFGPRSYGHTGFTGTSIWIDPDQQLFVILLTNRVFPTRDNRGHVAVRSGVADLVFSSIRKQANERYYPEAG